jgi:hypothetical protein
MKTIHFIISVFVVVIINITCKKVDPEPLCATSCNNGGTVNATCGCDCPAGFTGRNCEIPIVRDPACERNQTAVVSFKNNSSRRYDYDIIWDGQKLPSVLYRTVSNSYTFKTGSHTLIFKVKNTNTVACTLSNPVLAQCSSPTFSCDY